MVVPGDSAWAGLSFLGGGGGLDNIVDDVGVVAASSSMFSPPPLEVDVDAHSLSRPLAADVPIEATDWKDPNSGSEFSEIGITATFTFLPNNSKPLSVRTSSLLASGTDRIAEFLLLPFFPTSHFNSMPISWVYMSPSSAIMSSVVMFEPRFETRTNITVVVAIIITFSLGLLLVYVFNLCAGACKMRFL